MFGLFEEKKIKTIDENGGNLGKTESYYREKFGKNFFEVHDFCYTRLSIGKIENGTLFKYCPRCWVKIED